MCMNLIFHVQYSIVTLTTVLSLLFCMIDWSNLSQVIVSVRWSTKYELNDVSYDCYVY